MTDAPAKKSYVVLIFTQGGVDHYYTNWLGGWNDGGSNTATVVPSMSVKLAPNTGQLTDKETEVEFLLGEDSTEWLDSLVGGIAQAPVTMQVKLALRPFGPGATEAEALHHQGYYRLVLASKHADKEYGKVRLSFLHLKGLLDVPLGIPATTRCAWTLGDKTCGVDVASAAETATVLAIGRKSIQLSDPADFSVVTSKPDRRYWHRGYFERGGLRVGIRDWDELGTSKWIFSLVNDAPPEWVGEEVTIYPGCDKLPTTCDTRWSNLEQFGGFGIAIPAHHPVTESP